MPFIPDLISLSDGGVQMLIQNYRNNAWHGAQDLYERLNCIRQLCTNFLQETDLKEANQIAGSLQAEIQALIVASHPSTSSTMRTARTNATIFG